MARRSRGFPTMGTTLAIDGEVRVAASRVARCAVAGEADARRQRPRSRMVAPLGRLSVRGGEENSQDSPGARARSIPRETSAFL